MSSFRDYAVSRDNTLSVSVSSSLISPIAAILDSASFFVASYAAEMTHDDFVTGSTGNIAVALNATLEFWLLGNLLGLYRLQVLAFPDRHIRLIVFAALVGAAADACLLILYHTVTTSSRGTWLTFTAYSVLAVVCMRFASGLILRVALNADAVRGRRVVLIGSLSELGRLTAQDTLRFGFRDVARVTISCGSGVRVMPDDVKQLEHAIAMARARQATELALVVPWSWDRALPEIAWTLRRSPLPVRLYPDGRTRDILVHKRQGQFDPYFSVELQREPLNYFERACKRLLDILIAGAGLACLLPLLVFIAVLIKLDSAGPVIFKQRRKGFDNREFRIWKFRSMFVLEDASNGVVQARKGDSRVTPVGRLLRRTSIDELPQLFNVLRGDMSVVGPRPHAIAHDEHYGRQINAYALRHHVKPGLTGAAQVLGLRGETATLTEMEARIQADLWYINHWSFLLDIKIILQTFGALLKYEAY